MKAKDLLTTHPFWFCLRECCPRFLTAWIDREYRNSFAQGREVFAKRFNEGAFTNARHTRNTNAG